MPKKTTSGLLIILPCHCVFDKDIGKIYAEHPEDRPIYEAQIIYAFKHLEWRKEKNPLLIISGGFTKGELKISESQSYLDYVKYLELNIPENVILEEYALVSIENLLYSLYMYKLNRKCYPETIDVISWSFKKERYEITLKAINDWSRMNESFDVLNFFPVGDLFGDAYKRVILDETKYIRSLEKGIEFYYENPFTKKIIKKRDAYNLREMTKDKYTGFPFPW